MSFLKAEWRKLIFVNYEIDPKVLMPHVPYGTELDFWNGKCYVSVVGFMFVNVRILGLKIPFHINFEEVNLRFYVKRGDKRGVVFVKEIVPKLAITLVANTIYKENYETRKMRHSWISGESTQKISYGWKIKNWQNISVETSLKSSSIHEGSEEEFITEHYWGYARKSETKTIEYEVTHPKWVEYKVNSFNVEIDFGANYGQEFSFLDQQIPSSVMLTEGSEITVEKNMKIT